MQPQSMMPVWFVILGLAIVAVIAIAIVTIVALAMGKARFGWVLGAVACLAVPALLAGLFVTCSVRSVSVGGPAVSISYASSDGHVLPPAAESASSTVSTSQPTPASEATAPPTEQPITIETLPEWVFQPEATRDGVTTLVLSSQRFVTQDEAEEQLTGELVKRVRQYFQEAHSDEAGWTLPADYAMRRTVKQRHVELIPKKFSDDVTVDMKRVHWQVELSPGIRNELEPLWREQVVKQRLTRYGGGVGAVALLLLIASTYNRINASTHGAYRGWLRLASLTLVAAGGTAAAFLS
jgi:hypothetical protein